MNSENNINQSEENTHTKVIHLKVSEDFESSYSDLGREGQSPLMVLNDIVDIGREALKARKKGEPGVVVMFEEDKYVFRKISKGNSNPETLAP